MTTLFAEELGVKGRCFFISNPVNSQGEYYCDYPSVWLGPRTEADFRTKGVSVTKMGNRADVHAADSNAYTEENP